MKVTKLETIRLDEFPNLVWVHVQTDEGLVGLGETFFGAQAVEAYLHETVAPYLIGKDLLQIDRHARALYGYLGYCSSGVELRGNSAIDIALWDLFGKATNQPIYQLLGGLTRANPDLQHLRRLPLRPLSPAQLVDNGGPDRRRRGSLRRPRCLPHRADELALGLTSQGITGMKIWPFDPLPRPAAASRPAISTPRSNRSARSARLSVARSTSWSSSTRSGISRPQSSWPRPGGV